VAEVDAIAVGPDGEKYAVEVKAGRIDLQALRQAVANAMLIGARPLVVGKGFADEAAEAAARKLNVKTIELDDVFLVDPEELEQVVEAAVAEVAADVLGLLLDPSTRPAAGEAEKLRAIAESASIVEAAERLGVGVGEVAATVRRLRQASKVLARHGWMGVRLAARLQLLRLFLEARLDSLARSVDVLSKLTGEG